MFDIMTNRKALMPSRGLYCVWIRANQDQNAPLVSIWIDPSMKSFESGANEQALAPACSDGAHCESENQEGSQGHEEIDHFRWLLRPVLGFLMLACIQFFAIPGASAQTAGKLSGIVRDKTGAVVAGAILAATNTSTGVKQTTTTDVQGSYSFPVLSIGQYETEATADGFKPYRQGGIAIDTTATGLYASRKH